MRTITLIKIISLIFFSCSNQDFECTNAPDVSDIQVNLKVERLEEQLFSLESKNAIREFLDNHPQTSRHFLQAGSYPHDSILVNRLYKLTNDSHIDTVYQETREVFGDLSDLKNQFKQAFQYAKHYIPDFEAPAIQTMVTGLGNDLYVSDSLIIIGLDYYIGEDATYRPDMPNYLLKRFRPENIVPSCILLLSNKYNNTNREDDSMLADMIYYGKSYHFAKKTMPCTPDSLIIGYTSENISSVEYNEQKIWSYFIDRELLYETSHIVKNRYIGERPSVVEISKNCPGRVARWLGWQIVDHYARQTDTDLLELMKTADAQQIFQQSKYKPD